MACIFSTSHVTSKNIPKLRHFVHFDLDMPRHNGVQFFIFYLASWLRTRRFSEPTSNYWKNILFGDFPTFSRTWIFFLLKFYLL